VAQLLKSQATYTEIVEKTGVSTATIGRVNRALNYGSGGYQLVLEKVKGNTDK
jgi:TrpR-related protein YerC/YecD